MTNHKHPAISNSALCQS